MLDRMKMLIDGLVMPACIVDAKQFILYANYEFLDLAMISQRDIRRGIACCECLKFDVFSGQQDLLKKAFAAGQSIKLREIKGKNAKGEYLSLTVSAIPLSILTDELDAAIIVFSNLTLEENIQEKYKVLYEKEHEERRKIEEFNRRLNELVDERTRELSETHQKLKVVYGELSEELEMAKRVQTAMLPRELPTFLNMQVSSVYVPTGKVGGDLFDIFVTPAGKTAVLIFDVSGHGVPASLIGVMAKMLFARFIERLQSPAEIFAEVNKYICNSIKTDHYLTAFLGLIDPATNHMVYSRAAHPCPVVFRAKTGALETLQGKGLFIGHSALAKIAVYCDNEFQFDNGDRVLFYTDGITEAANPEEQLFGSKRLEALVALHHALEGDHFLSAILENHAAYTRGVPLRDDFTLLSLQIGAMPGARLQSGFGPNESPHVLTFSIFDEIEKICAIILREIEANGYSEQDIWSVKLCMHEILINAIIHGNKNDVKKMVSVYYDITPEKCRISVIDQGDGFDFSAIADPNDEKNLLKDGGRGLFFVRRYMDDMTFNEQGNRIMIVKHPPGEG